LPTTEQKKSFVSTANKPLIDTLMTISDATVSIAITGNRIANGKPYWLADIDFGKIVTINQRPCQPVYSHE